MIVLSTPITGTAQTGLATPTYTIVADQAPDTNAKQYAVTALGGTQTGVTVHSTSSPFLISFWRPRVLAVLPRVNPVTGALPSVPKNTFKIITLKGVLPLAGQAPATMIIRTEIILPAGSDVADPLSIRAALSMHTGSINQTAAGIGDTLINAVL